MIDLAGLDSVPLRHNWYSWADRRLWQPCQDRQLDDLPC